MPIPLRFFWVGQHHEYRSPDQCRDDADLHIGGTGDYPAHHVGANHRRGPMRMLRAMIRL